MQLTCEKETSIITVLLDYGADPNVIRVAERKSKQGSVVEVGDKVTPLHIAARYGVVDVIELLLDDDRVSPNVVNMNHQTPLHFAAIHNQPKAVAVLTHRYYYIQWQCMASGH